MVRFDDSVTCSFYVPELEVKIHHSQCVHIVLVLGKYLLIDCNSKFKKISVPFTITVTNKRHKMKVSPGDYSSLTHTNGRYIRISSVVLHSSRVKLRALIDSLSS